MPQPGLDAPLTACSASASPLALSMPPCPLSNPPPSVSPLTPHAPHRPCRFLLHSEAFLLTSASP